MALIVLAVAALVGLLLARSIARPLRRLEAVAARVGGGELSTHVPPRTTVRPTCGVSRREFNRTTAKLAALLGRRSSSSPTRRTSCGPR